MFAAALLLFAPALAQPSQVEGSYFRGDRLGVNQMLHLIYPSQGFSFLWRGCLGVYGRASGTWSLSADRLVLTDGSSCERGEYHVVRWEPRDGRLRSLLST